MKITVQLSSEAARAMHQRVSGGVEGQDLVRLEEELGSQFRPLHPGSEDPQLATYFALELPHGAAAEPALSRLRAHKAVDAAYLKPPDEPP